MCKLKIKCVKMVICCALCTMSHANKQTGNDLVAREHYNSEEIRESIHTLTEEWAQLTSASAEKGTTVIQLEPLQRVIKFLMHSAKKCRSLTFMKHVITND